MSKKRILSFDIGTSSVKACVIVRDLGNNDLFEIESRSKCSYDVNRIKPKNLPSNYSQQDVKVILEAIDDVLKKIQCQGEIDLITICGQQHSCVLWDEKFMEKIGNPMKIELDFNLISDNYDWRDGRCDENFLKSLPVPSGYYDKISSGYGCATLFWLQRFHPDFVGRFNRSGTIMDWFVSLLCKLQKVPISEQNALCWGYFDPLTESWDKDILKEAGFPVHLLPTPKKYNTIVGKTKLEWHCIKADIPVMVPLGDLQAVMYCALKEDMNSIVMNMGTSAQLCHLTDIDPKEIPRKTTNPIKSVDYYPYKNNKYLIVAPSLNGGNVLRSFISFLQSTIENLTGIHMTEQGVWDKILDQIDPSEENNSVDLDNENSSILRIKPTLFGERHDLSSVCHIEIGTEPPSLIRLTKCLCRGLVQNLFEMMPNLSEKIRMNHSKGIKTNFICTGNVLATNSIIKQIVKEFIADLIKNSGIKSSSSSSSSVQINFIDDCDAEVGCAIFSNRFFSKPLNK